MIPKLVLTSFPPFFLVFASFLTLKKMCFIWSGVHTSLFMMMGWMLACPIIWNMAGQDKPGLLLLLLLLLLSASLDFRLMFLYSTSSKKQRVVWVFVLSCVSYYLSPFNCWVSIESDLSTSDCHFLVKWVLQFKWFKNDFLLG